MSQYFEDIMSGINQPTTVKSVPNKGNDIRKDTKTVSSEQVVSLSDVLGLGNDEEDASTRRELRCSMAARYDLKRIKDAGAVFTFAELQAKLGADKVYDINYDPHTHLKYNQAFTGKGYIKAIRFNNYVNVDIVLCNDQFNVKEAK